MVESKHVFVVFQRLYSVLNSSANSMGDLGLFAYACLVDIAEFTEGISRTQIEGDFSNCKEPMTCVSELEDKELVERVRNSRDRRAFAIRVTAKGHARIALLDEALSIALIDASGKLTEETFNHLEDLLAILSRDGREQRKVNTLLSGRLLAAICNYHAITVRESSLLGMPSVQMAVLIMLQEPDVVLTAERMAHRLSLSPSAMMLQLENLCDRGAVKAENLNGPYTLLEDGYRKIEWFSKHFDSLTRRFFSKTEDVDTTRSDAWEELLEFVVYLFSSREEGYKTPDDKVVSGLEGITSRAAALSSLLSTLAQLFSYPSRKRAQEQTSVSLIDRCNALLAAAGFSATLPDDVCIRFASWAELSDDVRSTSVRSEITRLFYVSPRLVSLNGSDWVRAHPTAFSVSHGERAAVGLEYRNLGLRNRPGTNEPFDNLVSELDFLSYLASSEARAFEAGDAGSAREWEQIRTEFVDRHFGELAHGVASGIREKSDNAFLLLYAALLEIVAVRI